MKLEVIYIHMHGVQLGTSYFYFIYNFIMVKRGFGRDGNGDCSGDGE